MTFDAGTGWDQGQTWNDDASPWLTVDDYKAWARVADDTDDPAIADAVAAARLTVRLRCPRAFEPGPAGDYPGVPPMITQAALLLANRLMSRRNSPDGVVGVSDMGTATILSYDADINLMLGPWSEMVLA